VSDATASAAVLTAETCPFGDAIVDPGATATVAGFSWLRDCLATLDPALRAPAVERPASVVFLFGHARRTLADRDLEILFCLGGKLEWLRVYVVPGDLPLRMNRLSLLAASAVLDLVCDALWLKDPRFTVPLRVDATGHLLVNLLPLPVSAPVFDSTWSRSRHVSFSSGDAATVAASDVKDVVPAAPAGVVPVAAAAAPGGAAPAPSHLSARDAHSVLSAGVHLPAVFSRLHRTYAYPGAAHLLHLPKDAGCLDAAIAPALRRVTEILAVCPGARSRPPRAFVTLPRPAVLNDNVAIDLAEASGRGRFLHEIELGTRLSRCVVVPEKEAPTIVRALISVWICVYGAMRWLLSDLGREFHKALVHTLGERFNVSVNLTVCQSAWSNGICERQNGVVKHMVVYLASDHPSASVHEHLDHSCFSKKSLAVHGRALPFQLATVSQPRLPSVLSDDLPNRQESHLPTEADLARTVALLAASRADFARAEASHSVRRALNRPVPGDPGRVFSAGSVVRYSEKAQASSRHGMHCPATVVSHSGRVAGMLQSGEYKTRNASDMENFDAADPAPSHAAEPGVVGAALSALRNAVLPPGAASASVSAIARPSPLLSPSVPPLGRLDPAAAVALVVMGDSLAARHASVPPGVLSAGEGLVAEVDAAGLAASFA